MEKMIFNFIKKEREVEMYGKIRKMLIGKGYKPLNNIKYTSYMDYNRTKYPYTITLTTHKVQSVQHNRYSVAA